MRQRLADPEPNNLTDTPMPAPASFRYKSISSHFTIWGYDVTVSDRESEEFLELTNVTATSMTLNGHGNVRVVTPRGRTCEVVLDGQPKTIATTPAGCP